MLNTVYPGRRFSTGGALKDGKVFAEFFGIFMTDTHTPIQWQNICEASGFIMFFPMVFYAMGYYYFKTKKADPLLISISIFLLIGLLYVLLGFPAFLSKITFFNESDFPPLPMIVGVANCFYLFVISEVVKWKLKGEKSCMDRIGSLQQATLIFMLIVTTQINKATENFYINTGGCCTCYCYFYLLTLL
jgi:hypothetical protein